MTHRVHVLEGTRSNGELVYSCGTPDAGAIVPYVGVAMLKRRPSLQSEVTCLRCRRKHSMDDPRTDSAKAGEKK